MPDRSWFEPFAHDRDSAVTIAPEDRRRHERLFSARNFDLGLDSLDDTLAGAHYNALDEDSRDPLTRLREAHGLVAYAIHREDFLQNHERAIAERQKIDGDFTPHHQAFVIARMNVIEAAYRMFRGGVAPGIAVEQALTGDSYSDVAAAAQRFVADPMSFQITTEAGETARLGDHFALVGQEDGGPQRRLARAARGNVAGFAEEMAREARTLDAMKPTIEARRQALDSGVGSAAWYHEVVSAQTLLDTMDPDSLADRQQALLDRVVTRWHQRVQSDPVAAWQTAHQRAAGTEDIGLSAAGRQAWTGEATAIAQTVLKNSDLLARAREAGLDSEMARQAAQSGPVRPGRKTGPAAANTGPDPNDPAGSPPDPSRSQS